MPATRYEYDSSNNLKFKGVNPNDKALDDDAGWTITKYIVDTSNNLVGVIGPRCGKWQDRNTTLFL